MIEKESRQEMQFTRCFNCGYEAITYNPDKCRKCGGELEIISRENKEVLNG
jgi:rRNA maturation endonuclease Nob1